MNASEINQKVIAIAEKYGYKGLYGKSATVFHVSFIKSNECNYSCTVWVSEKKQFIESGHHKGYDAMLEAFEDNIIHYQKAYSNEKQEVEA